MNPSVKKLIIALAVLGGLAILGALATVFLSTVADAADLPEYTDLTFVDIADLDRQCDSVLAVCDTIYHRGYHVSISENDSSIIRSDTTYDAIGWSEHCRRWAGREIWEKPMNEEWWDGSIHLVWKGQARLWWWEVER
jgi:hypothetical protein